jgi:acylphosphatase
MNECVCKRFSVSGRVQGVWFRASTATEGKRRGLRGWALNLPDGRVEVLACGPAESIADFGKWLEFGPPLAQVTRVDEDSEDASQFDTLSRPPGAVSF